MRTKRNDMKVCKNYASTLDQFSYILGCEGGGRYLNEGMTTALAFEDLKEGIAIVRARAKKPAALDWLRICEVEADLAHACYKARDLTGGAAHIQFAERCFRHVRNKA